MGMLGLHIKNLRKNAGLTLQQLATRVDVGTTTIKNIETGYLAAPNMKLLEKIAETFFVPVDDLINSVSPNVRERAKMVHVAEYISCEKPFLQPDLVVETVFIDRDDLRDYEYIGIRMSDNSMIDAHICPGDSVIIRLGDTIKNGDKIACVYNGTNSLIRRVYMNGDEVVLKAENSSGVYPDIRLNKEKDNFKIIGKVIRWLHIDEEND